MNTTLARKMFSLLFIGSLVGTLLSGFVLPEENLIGEFQAESTRTPEPTPTEEPPTRHFMQFDEISFYYISSVATKVTGRAVEKNLNVNDPINPKMDQFEFENYSVVSQIKPRINVFSVQEFTEIGGESVTKQVEALKRLTAEQPATPDGYQPMLMGEPAIQLMRASIEYIKFQNGSGVRYIAQYGGQPWPFDNGRLFYTFQGLTNDGAYYVSAVLPVNHPALEGDDGFARLQNDYTKFQADYPAYVDYIQKLLNTEQPGSFNPNLASLDAMIKSMVVEKKAPAPGKPTSQPTMTVTNSPAGCTNLAAFVADITVPDNTSYQPGESFKKTWRLQNIGTCTWTSDYRLVFQSGDAMGAPAASPLTNANVPPNGNLDVSVNLKAPADPGSYQGFFKLRAPGNFIFGIQPNGSNAFWVLINVVSPEEPEEPALEITPHIILTLKKPLLTLIAPP